MSQSMSANEPTSAPASSFELALGEARLKMENVSERVQLAVVSAVSGIAIAAIAAWAVTQNSRSDSSDSSDHS